MSSETQENLPKPQKPPKTLEENLGCEWYDASKINCFRQCPQKYFYRYELGIITSGKPSVHLTFGSAVHLALESIYKGTADVLVSYAGKQIPYYISEFLNNFTEADEAGFKTRETGVELLHEYRSKWGSREPFSVDAIEQSACLDYGDFKWITRMDLLINWDEEMPLDHKTTSRFGDAFEGGFKIDIQMTGYIMATRRLRGNKCNKAVINALRVTKRISDESFLRKVTTRREDELERWELEIKRTIEDVRKSRRDGFWPMYGNSCYAYNTECEYRSLCLSSPMQREELIEANYVVDRWEPTL